jgi:hypothetical protein
MSQPVYIQPPSAEEKAEHEREMNRIFIVTYLPEPESAICQLVLTMEHNSLIIDMIQQLPYCISMGSISTEDKLKNFDKFFSVFQGRADKEHANAHVQLVRGDWDTHGAQDIIITTRSKMNTDGVDLHMHWYELRTKVTKYHVKITDPDFRYHHSRLDDMSRVLRMLK